MSLLYADRWESLGSIDEGGQAHVFRVKDKTGEVKAPCALKRLKNKGRLERFKDEVEAVKRLQHEHILRLIDFSLEAEKPFIVTEYCEGGNLADAKTKFWQESPVRTLELFREICGAVSYAHAHDVIHRDLKPENIYLRTKTGPAVVGDFGICHIADDGRRFTLTDEAVGSWYYMAPELAKGRVQTVDRRCDTYSLGKVLYWLFSDRVLDRESYRDRASDLRGWQDLPWRHWDNIYMEHVNRLLDHMIVENPEGRLHVDSIEDLVRRAVRLLDGPFNPIAPDMLNEQPCQYCGHGTYKVAASNNIEAGNYGLRGAGAPDPRILICDECGHVQFFRVDKASQKGWWAKSE